MWNSNNNTPSINANSSSIDLLPVSVPMLQDLQAELRWNIDFCAANRLTQTRKWLSELLVATPVNFNLSSQDSLRKPTLGFSSNQYQQGINFYEEPSSELDQVNLGRALFDLREYKKCTHVLS